MTSTHTSDESVNYYSGPERRLARQPRRKVSDRRHRLRTEALISDCRSGDYRRAEDEDGFIPISSLYLERNQPQTRK